MCVWPGAGWRRGPRPGRLSRGGRVFEETLRGLGPDGAPSRGVTTAGGKVIMVIKRRGELIVVAPGRKRINIVNPGGVT